MSKKSIFYSILSVILFVIAIFGIVYIFKFSIVAGIGGIVLLIIPAFFQRKALDEAEGIIDKVIAKFIVPALFLFLAFISIMSVFFWIQL
ncbi:MAG: hypothetical protein J1F69_01725 [Clostridiales bacterium]|nr:hypothetical protein [Clostridiales bacterium]